MNLIPHCAKNSWSLWSDFRIRGFWPMASSSENSVITVNAGFTKTIKRSLSVMTMPTAVFSTTASVPQFEPLPRRPSPNGKWRSQIFPEPPTHAEQSADEPMEEGSAKCRRYTSLARLLKRVFNIDIETCLCCGGQLKIIAAIEGPPVIRKILPHLGLLSYPPPHAPAGYYPYREADI